MKPTGPDLSFEASPVNDVALAPRLSTIRTVTLATGMLLTYFLGAASTGSVTILIPRMASDLGKTELETQWVASAYTFAFACGLIFSGRLADTLGRRKLYLAGLTIYAVFAVVTGVVKNRVALSLCRAMSGLGMSIASPAGFGIIGATIRHEPARTIAFAASGLGNPIGAVFGNLIGGLMASIGPNGWSYLFFLLAGLAALLLAGAFFIVPSDPDVGKKFDERIDWTGGLCVTAGICLFTFSLTESGIAVDGWRASYVPALLATSLVLLAVFVLWSLHLEHRTTFPPIFKISVFTRRHGLVGITLACVLLISMCILAWIYTTSIFCQNYKGLSPLANALAVLPAPIVGLFAAAAVVLLAPRVSTPHILCVGSAMTAASSIMYAAWPEGTSFWALEFPAQLIHPWGTDFVFGLGNILMSNLVDQNELSVGGALFQTSGQVGGALGICLSSLISSEIAEQAGSVLAGVRAAFYFSAACGFAVSVIALLGFRNVKLAKDVGQIQ
ncbi:major facilitator superfamily domain-containing protein [Dioszegia hungarica]|uniref:Major facilitator superfamily domain-containing protein n=1 Tax=Dioszegia hungarica TaxID=4972 RepID=A0AA38LYH6_9TREE|nr:major facilitator superfamily domain-containing protein [Dioszegia hungarica]KAI9638984.1 major facilitator superfamily domain-containing protein [Dioszegia hungarica]